MQATESGASTFDLPDEVLEVLPSDPYEQLDVARKITSIALSTRVSALESESADLRAQLAEKDDLIADLQSQVESLDASLADAVDRLAQAEQEKARTPCLTKPTEVPLPAKVAADSVSVLYVAGEAVDREPVALGLCEEA